MINMPQDIMGRSDAKCILPIISHPDPNPPDQPEYLALNELSKEKYTWIFGSLFFYKYFTVFDERPVIENLES